VTVLVGMSTALPITMISVGKFLSQVEIKPIFNKFSLQKINRIISDYYMTVGKTLNVLILNPSA